MIIQPLDLSDAGARTSASCNNVLGNPLIVLNQKVYDGTHDLNKVYLEVKDIQKLFIWCKENNLIN